MAGRSVLLGAGGRWTDYGCTGLPRGTSGDCLGAAICLYRALVGGGCLEPALGDCQTGDRTGGRRKGRGNCHPALVSTDPGGEWVRESPADCPARMAVPAVGAA